MRILVTGATGFVGRHVVTDALSRGHTVIAPVRDLARARNLLGVHDALTLVEIGDLADVGQHDPDALIHLVWTDTGNYLAPSTLFANLEPQFRFLERQLAAGLRNLTVAGTCLEYGLQEGAMREDQTPRPVTFYGIAKQALHDSIRIAAACYGAEIKWLRFFYLYGEGQKTNSLLPQLNAAIARGDAVFEMSPGQQIRDFIHVSTAAANVVTIAEQTGIDGAFNIGNGRPMRVVDLVHEVLRLRGVDMRLNLARFAYPVYEPFQFWADISRLVQIPGIRLDEHLVL